MTYEFIMEAKLGIKKNKYWRTGQRMSLKLYSPALTRLAGEKTRQTLSNAYAAILPHPFFGAILLQWNSYTVTDTENDKTDISGLLQSSLTVTSLMYPWEMAWGHPQHTKQTLGSPGLASLWTGDSIMITTTFKSLMDMQNQG